ncbi:MAG: hypothetical protein AAF944_00560 [Bacteroidota bacterium]
MTDLRLNRKTRQKPIWPWLLLLLVVLAIMFWLISTEPSSTTFLLNTPNFGCQSLLGTIYLS